MPRGRLGTDGRRLYVHVAARDRAVVPIHSTHRNREVRVVGGAERIRFDASTVAHNEIPRAPPALRS